MSFAKIFLVFLIAAFTVAPAIAEEKEPVAPASNDRCAVCGMFVAKYPAWTAEIVFKDGSYAVFDGAKDMFTYYHDVAKYGPSKKQSDIASIYVTDYYTVSFINARKAWYVSGSDVPGPMGSEFVAFATMSDAREFRKDHKGKAVLKFDDIRPEVLKGLK
jgi:nitrous oxide reductase accessory protein NosL